jgi:hypothetical protein
MVRSVASRSLSVNPFNNPPSHLTERTRILLALPKILNSMLNTSLAHHWLSTTSLIMSLSSRLVQATPLVDAPIAQLPGVDISTAAQAGRADEKLRGQNWQRYLAGMGDEDKDKLKKAFGLTLDGEGCEAALRRIPLLEVSNVSFKGEFFDYDFSLTSPSC